MNTRGSHIRMPPLPPGACRRTPALLKTVIGAAKSSQPGTRSAHARARRCPVFPLCFCFGIRVPRGTSLGDVLAAQARADNCCFRPLPQAPACRRPRGASVKVGRYRLGCCSMPLRNAASRRHPRKLPRTRRRGTSDTSPANSPSPIECRSLRASVKVPETTERAPGQNGAVRTIYVALTTVLHAGDLAREHPGTNISAQHNPRGAGALVRELATTALEAVATGALARRHATSPGCRANAGAHVATGALARRHVTTDRGDVGDLARTQVHALDLCQPPRPQSGRHSLAQGRSPGVHAGKPSCPGGAALTAPPKLPAQSAPLPRASRPGNTPGCAPCSAPPPATRSSHTSAADTPANSARTPCTRTADRAARRPPRSAHS